MISEDEKQLQDQGAGEVSEHVYLLDRAKTGEIQVATPGDEK